MHFLPHSFPRPRAVERAVSALRTWPVESQQRSRRNAMVAATALAQRRAERDDVEDFLAGLDRRRGPGVAPEAAHG